MCAQFPLELQYKLVQMHRRLVYPFPWIFENYVKVLVYELLVTVTSK